MELSYYVGIRVPKRCTAGLEKFDVFKVAGGSGRGRGRGDAGNEYGEITLELPEARQQCNQESNACANHSNDLL